VYEYQVEGLAPQTLDWVEYITGKQQPLCARFDGAHDTNGDGYIEVSSGVAEHSRIRHTRLSVIYVLPQGTSVPNDEAIFSGAMNSQCVWHIDVGATPEQGPANQDYDKSDLSFARFKLHFGGTVPPNTTNTYWLRVPPIHRREPVSMGYMAHAFRDVLPARQCLRSRTIRSRRSARCRRMPLNRPCATTGASSLPALRDSSSLILF